MPTRLPVVPIKPAPMTGEWIPMSAAYSWTHAALSPELATLRAQASADPARLFDYANDSHLRALHAQAVNTQRAYTCDWRSFVLFCTEHGHPALPATPSALEAFIEVSCAYSPEVRYKYVAADAPRRNLKASQRSRAGIWNAGSLRRNCRPDRYLCA